jgi:hypothetical protein
MTSSLLALGVVVAAGIALGMLVWLASGAAIDSVSGPLSQLSAMLAEVVEKVVEMTGGIFNWL